MIAIVDYGAGNLFSVHNALDFLGIAHQITRERQAIDASDGVILPGVGAFPKAMAMLRETGLVATLVKAAAEKPFLGICLGMQLLFDAGYEFGETPGLGLMAGTVRLMEPAGQKIPHMGWNSVHIHRECPLLSGIKEGDYVYYVHSYAAVTDERYLVLSSDYGQQVTGLVHDGRFLYGAQFHPEKSGAVGLTMLKNFGGLVK